MAKALWNGVVLAESDQCEIVEGNLYFPPDAVDRRYLRHSTHHTTCPWKGDASYYHIEVDGNTNSDAAWYYPEPTPEARRIKDYVAFWKGVEVRG